MGFHLQREEAYPFKQTIIDDLTKIMKKNETQGIETMRVHKISSVVYRLGLTKEIKLTRKEFMMLEYLLRNKGLLLSRNQLLEHAWDRNVDIFTNVIDTHIKNLRRKLGRSGKCIETVYGSGYRIKDEKGGQH